MTRKVLARLGLTRGFPMHAWLVCTVLAVALLPARGSAQQTVRWDHAKCPSTSTVADAVCTPVFEITAQPGEKITLEISHTCRSDFTYSVVPIPLAEDAQLQAGNTPCDDTHPVEIKHDPQYGGYIVYVTRKTGTKPAVGDARVTISVRTSEWKVEFAGGFTVNGLTDNAFTLREVQVKDATGAATTRYQVVTQDDRKDDVNRSVASFVHLHHSSWESRRGGYPGLTFGLGLDPDRSGEYYFGPSWLFGNRAALTAGVVVGQIHSLPAGRQLGDTVTDANALANLGSRRALRWFVGISYSFLGGGRSDLEKPFQGQAPLTTTGTASGTPRGGTTPTNTLVIAKSGGDPPAVPTAPLVVTVKEGGSPAAGLTVTWTVEPARANGITVNPATSTTDAQGNAQATVQRGTSKESQVVKVTACKSNGTCTETPVEFTIPALP